ncbi:hypothetical protein PXK58_00785 [Phaeobacter gallaeciensis]|uniref:hypothetical protein n=1 Tax=Phaeobacter gallaeciensis TaxID=60890 RepID=UPI0023801A7F|nr:hypothetical protein [Phaeobacter gallaeciensis]MDE4272980.1 hypothetical protein [Phaeobacter gallaeciensis]MDE4298068.1 hypothetical protein [Phaeobacter gallaeciensis]MDE5183256.1 hypothetical protein [Phaeobacter gallaeciensis]
MENEVSARSVCLKPRVDRVSTPGAGLQLLPFDEWQFYYLAERGKLAVGAWLNTRLNSLHWEVVEVMQAS